MEEIYIFGAHSRAQTLKEYLVSVYPDIYVKGYIVDSLSDNANFIDGVPVFEIHSLLDTRNTVYIATRGIYHEKIRMTLEESGFKNIIPVTYELDIKLRNKYVRKVFTETDREFIKIDEIAETGNLAAEYDPSVSIYVF